MPSATDIVFEFLSFLLSLLAIATIFTCAYLIVQRLAGNGMRDSLSRIPIEYLIIILLLALNMCLGCYT